MSVGRIIKRIVGWALLAATFADRYPDLIDELDAALNTLAAGFTRNMVCDPANVQPEEGGGGAYGRGAANFFPDGFDAGREAMTQMRSPVLVLHGQCDFLPYAGVYEYVDRFPNARYEFMEGAGHIFWWDRPAAYLGTIRKFLRSQVDSSVRDVASTP